ncbi:MAG: IS5 family transposase [Gemmatimonadales bacterium]
MPQEPADHALGRSRGGWGSKLHLVSDSRGLPLAIAVSPGQAHESQYLTPVLNAVRVPQAVGRPRQRPAAVAGDRAYSYPRLRRWLAMHRMRAVIPTRSDQPRRPLDRAAYRHRNVIERCVGWLKEGRRIATRYDKLAIHFLGALKLAMIQKHLAMTLSNTP